MLRKYLSKKNSILSLFILCSLTIYSRYLFVSKYLYEWDSVQFALSIGDFDILWHHPHPPGYVFYVLLIKVADFAFHNPQASIIFISIFFSVISIIIFYKFCTLFFESYSVAFLTTALLAVNPVFWFYGSTSTVYIMEAFTTILVGYLLFLSVNSSNFKPLVISSFLLGILGGFRQSILLLMAPLWLYVLGKKIRNFKQFLIILFSIFSSVIIWMLPTVINTGGIENYMISSKGLTAGSNEKIQNFFGNINNYLIMNLLNYSIWLVQGLSPVGFILIAVELFIFCKKFSIKRIIVNEKLTFLLLWLVPPTIFYLFYVEKPGYLLTIIPPLLTILSWSIIKISFLIDDYGKQRIFRYIMYYFLILIFSAWFIWPVSQKGIPQKIVLPAFMNQPPLSDYNWDISSREIRQKDFIMKTFISIFSNSSKYNSSNVVFFWAGGYPTWRHIMYYFPEFQSYWLVDKSVSGRFDFNCEYYVARDRTEGSFSGLPFWFDGQRKEKIDIRLDKDIEWIVWIADENTFVYSYVSRNFSDEMIDLPNNQVVLITANTQDVMDLGCFKIY